jgi:hypothetical protein
MPSPFPGMDPYLEDPVEWMSFHNPLIADIADTLNAELPSDYVARAELRCYVVHPKRQYLPDVSVRRERRTRTHSKSSAGIAVAERAIDPPLVLIAEPLEMREASVNVVSIKGEKRVVTAIEVLSPTNKLPGNIGWTRYRRKQREMVSNRINLLEIDLLRSGAHLVMADRELLNMERHWDYVASLQRSGSGHRTEAWAWSIREKMPVVAVPLEGDDDDVPLDLQRLIDHRYDAGAYDRSIDYTTDPIPALRPDDGEWANALLRENKLR